MITLPTPSQSLSDLSDALRQIIAQEIKSQEGSIPFSRFMELALYTPNLGYYSGTQSPIGKQGDFITAPEITPLFSQTLAMQCLEILQELPGSTILELGAGNGTMAIDLLLELERGGKLPKHYWILERSGSLKQSQQKAFQQHAPHLIHRVEWLDQLPKAFQGVILANEVMDALPVERFQIKDGIPCQLFVTLDKGKFAYSHNPILHPLIEKYLESLDLPHNYTSEICLALNPWISSLSRCLDKGVILLIDYGYPKITYYHPDRTMGTLQCYFQHRVHSDPLLHPGLQDITAHVNFSDVAHYAFDANLELLGYTQQSAFLLNCGLLEIAKNSSIDQIQQSVAIQRLCSPTEMGESHKVIALGKHFSQRLRGFKDFDKSQTL